MCNNECRGKNVTVNVWDSDCGNSGGITDTLLFDGIINAVGSYQLADDINNYDDVFVLHEQKSGNYRGSFYIPVSGLGKSNLVCHGDGEVSQVAIFGIVNDSIQVSSVNDSYRIVKIIGRKFS